MTNIHFTDQMNDYIQSQIASGAYADASEVARAGIRSLMQHESTHAFYSLKAELEAAEAQVLNGEVHSFDPDEFR